MNNINKPDAITIGELIDVLKKYDKNLPVYVRTKYSGDVRWTDDIPVKANGIAEMHPENKPKNITFLV